MSCPAPGALAAAAAGEHPAAAAHADRCPACRRRLDEDRALRAVLARWPPPRLDAGRRDRLAASVALGDRTRPRPRVAAAVALVVVASAAAAVALVGVGSRRAPTSAREVAPPAIDPGRRAAATAAPSPTSPPAASSALAPPVAPPPAAPPPVPAAPEPARIARAPGDRQPARPRGARVAATAEESAAIFRTGWRALRGGRFADAIAAFDRATDPVVAEDAVYWAAVAAERGGDAAEARRRFARFLTRFPRSPRAAAVRAELARPR
jgi:hypothetical protein